MLIIILKGYGDQTIKGLPAKENQTFGGTLDTVFLCVCVCWTILCWHRVGDISLIKHEDNLYFYLGSALVSRSLSCLYTQTLIYRSESCEYHMGMSYKAIGWKRNMTEILRYIKLWRTANRRQTSLCNKTHKTTLKEFRHDLFSNLWIIMLKAFRAQDESVQHGQFKS